MDRVWQSEEIGELAKALVAAQAALQPVRKECDNPFYHSKYADLASCKAALTPFYQQGIAIVQCPMPANPGFIALETTLLHTSGQWIKSRLEMPLAKHDPQGAGSALTYACRYALVMTGLVTEEDDDANATITPATTKPTQGVGLSHGPPPSVPASQKGQDAPASLTSPKLMTFGKQGKTLEEMTLDDMIYWRERIEGDLQRYPNSKYTAENKAKLTALHEAIAYMEASVLPMEEDTHESQR